MSRSVRDATLETRTARSRLEPSGKPYYRGLEPGLHLGYRKSASGAGKWVARHYLGRGAYEVETIAVADDFSDADGVAILSFRQAQELARERMVKRAHAAAGKTGPLTVRDVVADYLEWLEGARKSAMDARKRAEAFILPDLGAIEVGALTAERLHRWHVGLTKTAPRLRTKAGAEQQHREVEDDDEYRRRRRSTANRTLTVLKAALNRAWKAGKVSSDAAWRRVEPFESVDAARMRYLSVAEAKRLVNAAEPAFRNLVQAGLQTGARYGELARLDVQDFNADAGTIAVRTSKSGKARHVVLTDEGAAFFQALAAGRAGSAPLLPRADSGRWGASHQNRPMVDACERAKISPPISFHGLRHTWASHAVMNGVPLMVVARNLGHADTRMVEKHYGHLAPSFVADAIRANAPRFGAVVAGNVTVIGGRS